MAMKLVVAGSIEEVDAAAWDALDDKDSPFLAHGFLALLERSGSIGPKSAWTPSYLLCRDGARLLGAAPSYVRSDSYGEYVFDFAWAQAAMRAGLAYYPKITVAVPFTPATGPRLLCHREADSNQVRRALLTGLRELAGEHDAHSVHILLCRDDEAELAAANGYVRRATHQYHFRNPGYDGYEAFLGALRSQARKQLRKERGKLAAYDIRVQRGDELSQAEWEQVCDLYLHTAGRKWGRPYLTRRFFTLARELVGPSALVVSCREAGEIVAMSLSFYKGRHLYGRYWGSRIDADSLHFELCYHRLIEHAITERMTLVEAGAQGEHKIKRGFVPVLTHSAHAFADPQLHEAVARAVASETAELRAALPEWTKEAPFREDSLPAWPPVAGIDLS